MKNKQLIEEKIHNLEGKYKLGCWDPNIENLSKVELNKVLDRLDEEYTDVDVTIRKKKYVVEISTMDNEKDVNTLTQEEYISRYGNERYEED